MTTTGRLGRRKNVSPPALPSRARQEHMQRDQSLSRLDQQVILNQPSSSARRSVGPCRTVISPLLRRQRKPAGSGFLLLVATFLTAPSMTSVFCILTWIARAGWPGFGVQAEPCATVPNGSLAGDVDATGLYQITVTNDTAYDLSTLFACEGGDFNVSWFGVVRVGSTITIGRGTTVRIFGEIDTNSVLATTSRPISSTSASSNVSSDFELELETLSGDLNLPQELTSTAVVEVSDGVSFGPIFLVDNGELYLEGLTIRGGNATNSNAGTIIAGGGIYANFSQVSVSSCVFEDNFAEYLGGGIHTNRSILTVKDSVFRRNKAGFQSFAGDKDADGAGGGIGVRILFSGLATFSNINVHVLKFIRIKCIVRVTGGSVTC